MILGLTGHSGSGKTTACGFFKKLGFCHVNCDAVVHDIVYTDPKLHKQLALAFGEAVIKDGAVDRRTLAGIVFSDGSAYQKLMATVKPFVVAAVLNAIAQCGDKNVLVDAPALFEYGMQSICDVTVGVVCDNAVPRIVARDGITVGEAERRLAHQQSYSFYKQNCDYVIENNGTLNELESAVDQIYKKISEV